MTTSCSLEVSDKFDARVKDGLAWKEGGLSWTRVGELGPAKTRLHQMITHTHLIHFKVV